MYLLTVKDGLVTRYVGPYSTPKQASDDLERALSGCSERVSWQIHALEPPNCLTMSGRINSAGKLMSALAS